MICERSTTKPGERAFNGTEYQSTTGVSDVAVTMNAVLHVAAGDVGKQGMNEIFVTRNARALGDAAVARFDLNRVFESAGGERERMKETVVRLGNPLAQKVVR